MELLLSNDSTFQEVIGNFILLLQYYPSRALVKLGTS